MFENYFYFDFLNETHLNQLPQFPELHESIVIDVEKH